MRTILISMCLLAPCASAATHEYTVKVADDLSRVDVEAKFPGGVDRIRTRSRDAANFIRDPRDCERELPLRVNGRGIEIDTPLNCFTYSVDLRRAGDIDSGAMVVPVASWMWRPRLGGNDEILVTFDLPDEVSVSMPWQPLPGDDVVYRLVSSPQSGSGLAIFGRFEKQVVQVGDAELRVAIIPATRRKIGSEVVNWTRQTAAHITLAYGRFPNPDARVLLIPSSNWWNNEAVRFGRVVRDGGETVELYVDPSKPEEQFVGDWTATHEFAHLLLPYVTRSERWISEGFAQYYQNVLLARAGQYTQQHAWQMINDGLERGRASAPRLSPNEATSGGERSARMKIYWSGAALFLMADVELRRRSQNAVTLDTVLDRFQACCLPSRRVWQGHELFAALDELIEEPVFGPLYRQYADTSGFPPFRELLDRLGLQLDGGDVRLSDDAELAEIRAAISARRYTEQSDQ